MLIKLSKTSQPARVKGTKEEQQTYVKLNFTKILVYTDVDVVWKTAIKWVNFRKIQQSLVL